MDWNPQQEGALRAVKNWLVDQDKPVFRLFGYAGTGKTTLARHLAETVAGQTMFAAYTGKAALVMQRAGCADARTIHSLIYTPFELSGAREKIEALKERIAVAESEDTIRILQRELQELEASVRSPHRPKPQFSLNQESDLRQASLLVVDECSMVNEDMAMDLMSFDVPILVLGDPAQLPPVRGEGFFTNAEPDILLTQVQRQAKDNPIIEMATQVRERGDLGVGDYGSSAVVRGRPSPDEAIAFDQMICGLNRTRKSLNAWTRKRLGRANPLPEEGDRLICLKNNKEEGLLNGGMWNVVGPIEDDDPFLMLHGLKDPDTGRVLSNPLKVHRHILTGEERNMSPWEWREAQEFDYAYAITCHKSQGSQWQNIAVFDEWFMDARRQWLYTAITRAQESVKVYRR